MSKRMVAFTCNNCGKGIRCKEENLDRVLEGSAKCPYCGMTLQPQKESLRWESGDSTWGEQLETRKNALLRVAKHKAIAVAAFATARVSELEDLSQLDEELKELLEKHEFRRVAVDFTALKFMSSAVVSILVKFQTMVKNAGGALVLFDIPEPIYEVLKVMRLHKYFDIQKDRHDALKALMKQDLPADGS